MDLIFKSLSTRQKVDIVQLTKQHCEDNPNTELYIGCDSQNIKGHSVYAVALVLYNRTVGGRVFYARVQVPRIKDKFSRLWKEVDLSVQLAQFLTENGIQDPEYIDLDLNPDPRYSSNDLMRSAVGYVESMGYHARIKPYSIVATKVADILCKAKQRRRGQCAQPV